MKKQLAAVALISCAIFSAAGAATGPAPSLGDQAAVFDRLAGAWNTDYVFFDKDGTAKRTVGEFTADWVMEGRVMQSLYTIDRAAEHKEKYIGTSLSYFDAKSKSWKQAFVDPEADAVLMVHGGPVGNDRIVLTSEGNDGRVDRWSFDQIRADSFIYRDETSRDGGKSWHLNEEDHMTRQKAGGGR